ncbi:unnamed protein product [Closterium sp. Naga37s-1]|nr:unnamed protein product [Closterium sp. Naga37s-1]
MIEMDTGPSVHTWLQSCLQAAPLHPLVHQHQLIPPLLHTPSFSTSSICPPSCTPPSPSTPPCASLPPFPPPASLPLPSPFPSSSPASSPLGSFPPSPSLPSAAGQQHHPTSASTQVNVWAGGGGAGKGMVIGVVDTGIWPEHPSFSDAGFPSSKPAGWSGKCDTTSEFMCNNKLTGARAFYKGFKEDNGGPDLSTHWLSPRDFHPSTYLHGGSRQQGCAPGNKDVPMAGGKASGMAPAARLAMYKVFWFSSGSLFAVSADIEAAVNQAVADGVDVLSLSLGGMDSTDTYFSHMPYLAANPAGNAGPYSSFSGRTVDNFSPFYLNMGASTIGRGSLTLKATTAAATALSNSSSVTPAAMAYPSIAKFSSTGPLTDPSFDATGALLTHSILKLEIVGLGVDLYAAWPAEKVGKPVMSAIMTTAKTTDTSAAAIKNSYGEAATTWDEGAGHVLPAKVLDPGLTFDARAAAYRNFLAGQSMKRA